MGAYSEEIHRLMSVIGIARAEDPLMPIQMLQTFLAVARQPGITMSQHKPACFALMSDFKLVTTT